jgi:hypothetical protein
MSDLRTAHSPIVIDRVKRSRGDGDTVRLRLRGRRLAAAAESDLDALLVVQLHGYRHRFAGSKAGDEDPSPGSWRASFTVPDWGVPVEYGQASLWVGEVSVPVPPVGTRIRMPEPAASSAPAASEPPAVSAAAAEAEAGRAGPLAEVLLRETVSALHAELEQRSGREAALDGALERARAELVARTASQTELEATHAELRTELARLVEAVAEQQAEFDRRLDEARERSEAELARARGEAERARSELAQARAEADRTRAELHGAREQETGVVRTRQELAAVSERLAATTASDQMRAQEAASLREQLAITTISRDAAVAETAGLRAELSRLGSELAAVREQAGDGELGVAQQLLDDARALTAQLRGESRP